MYNFKRLEPEIPTIALPTWYQLIISQDPKTIKPYYVMMGFKTAGLELEGLSSTSSDFSYADFSGVIINNGYFSGCNFSYGKFNGSRFINTDLSMTTFREVNIKEMRISKSDCFGFEMRESELIGCEFEDINFTTSTFYDLKCKNCKFINCQFDTLTFNSTVFEDCDITDSFFSDLAISDFKLIRTDLNFARMYPFAREMLEECIYA